MAHTVYRLVTHASLGSRRPGGGRRRGRQGRQRPEILPCAGGATGGLCRRSSLPGDWLAAEAEAVRTYARAALGLDATVLRRASPVTAGEVFAELECQSPCGPPRRLRVRRPAGRRAGGVAAGGPAPGGGGVAGRFRRVQHRGRNGRRRRRRSGGWSGRRKSRWKRTRRGGRRAVGTAGLVRRGGRMDGRPARGGGARAAGAGAAGQGRLGGIGGACRGDRRGRLLLQGHGRRAGGGAGGGTGWRGAGATACPR